MPDGVPDVDDATHRAVREPHRRHRHDGSRYVGGSSSLAAGSRETSPSATRPSTHLGQAGGASGQTASTTAAGTGPSASRSRADDAFRCTWPVRRILDLPGGRPCPGGRPVANQAHMSCTGQASQRGDRAVQTSAPSSIDAAAHRGRRRVVVGDVPGGPADLVDRLARRRQRDAVDRAGQDATHVGVEHHRPPPVGGRQHRGRRVRADPGSARSSGSDDGTTPSCRSTTARAHSSCRRSARRG